MRINIFILGFAILWVSAVSDGARADAPASYTLNIATVAPKSSAWGQVFEAWRKAAAAKSNQAIDLHFFYGGSKGEAEMVANIRGGQIDGAALTANGLGIIDLNALVLQLPGVFHSWSQLDAVRNMVKPKLDEKFDKSGFIILGWGDIGEARFMSYGFKATKPSDLLPGSPGSPSLLAVKGDPILPKFYEVLGVGYKTLEIPEILTELTNHHINGIIGPALGAEQLQWSPNLDHINARVTGYLIGALVFSASKFRSLPPEIQAILKETGQLTGKALCDRIREMDRQAFDRISKKMMTYDSNDGEAKQWEDKFAQTRSKLRGAPFDPALFDMVIAGAK